MTDDVEVLRANFNAAKNELDAARDAVSRGGVLDVEANAAYRAARERFIAALRRFSVAVVRGDHEGTL